MPRGRDDDVIADGLELAEGVAVDLAVGDDGGDVVPWALAAVFGDGVEVGHEVDDHGLQAGQRRIGALDLLAVPVQVRILRAKQLLRQLQHAVLVLFRHAQHLHHHVQGIEERHVPGEVALVPQRRHAVDKAAGDLADAGLELAQVLRHEPGLGQAPVVHVVGVVHLDEGADQVRAAAGHLLDLLAALDGGEGREGVAVVEQLVVPLDLQNVRMARHDPERIAAVRLGDAERHLLAQPRKGGVDPRPVRIGLRVHDLGGDVLGNVRGDHVAHPSERPFFRDASRGLLYVQQVS